jgi:type VI secretion system secreted protein Hcp
MAQMIWVTITGVRQGKFTSDITRKGFEGKIDVINYTDSISVPTDGASGLPTGRRQHSPISITKHIDKTSPLLANAAYTNENLSSVKFEFVRPTPTLGGTVGEKVFFTIELTNSNIISLTRSMTGDARTESLELTFEKITITYVEGGIQADDDWSSGLGNQG